MYQWILVVFKICIMPAFVGIAVNLQQRLQEIHQM